MAKQNVTIEITFEHDPDAHNGKPARIYILQLLHRLNNEGKVKSITYKGKTKTFTAANPLKDIALRKVDSVDSADLPTPPEWLKDRTELVGINNK